MAIMRTIQAWETPNWVGGFTAQAGEQHVEAHRECEFPLPVVLQQDPGMWLYLVWRTRVICRCRLLRVEPRDRPVEVGSDEHIIDARCALVVEDPGEPAPREIRVRGFTGIRYIEGEEWEDVEAWANAHQ
jgi:hypothetical protein